MNSVAGLARARAARLRRLLPYLALLVATVFLLAESRHIRSTLDASDLGAAFWPRAVLLLLLACTVARVVAVLRTPLAAPDRPAAAATAPDGRQVAVVFASIALYVWLTEIIGFAGATFLYLLGSAWLLGYRRPVPALLVAAGVTLGLLYFFVRFVYVPLPLGVDPFEDLNVALFQLLGLY
jgi:hypothetical protein